MAGDVDINVVHLIKFINDTMTGTPNNIEILFMGKDKYVKMGELGEVLVDNRHLFLSKSIKSKFGGYANGERGRMVRGGRKEMVKKYGYDPKMFMHSVRLLDSAIEILKTGDYTTKRPNREFLLKCRSGMFTLPEAQKILDVLDKEMGRCHEKSKLPEMPDYDKINNLVIEINNRALELA